MSASSVIYVDRCKTISASGLYEMNASIVNNSLSSDCIVITAENVTLDCRGYSIITNKSYTGVYTNKSHTIIKGCIIETGNSSNGAGIELINSNYSTIQDCTINGSYYAVLTADSFSPYYLTIVNLTARDNYYGAFLFYASAARVINSSFQENIEDDIADWGPYCNFYYENVNGSGGRPILFYNSSANVSNIAASHITLCGAADSNFTNITLSGSERYKNNAFRIYYTNNSVFNMITSNENYEGFVVLTSFNNLFTNLSANGSIRTGFYIGAGAGNKIENSIFTETYLADFWVYNQFSFPTGCDMVVENVTGSGGRQIGFYNSSVNISNKNFSYLALCNADNSLLENITVMGSESLYNNLIDVSLTDYLVIKNLYSSGNRRNLAFYLSSSNNIVYDSYINDSGQADVLLSGGSNNTFVNVTYDGSELASLSPHLIRKWRYAVFVNDSKGRVVSGASVVAYNATNIVVENLTTESDGRASGALIDYIHAGGTRMFYSNYTINVSKSCYSSSSRGGVNVTSLKNIEDYFMLNDTCIPEVQNLSSSYYACEAGLLSERFNISNRDITTVIITVSPSDSQNPFVTSPTSASGNGTHGIELLSIGALAKSSVGVHIENISLLESGYYEDSEITNIIVLEINNAPSLSDISAQTATVGTAFSYQAAATDSEDGNQASGNLTFNSTFLGTNTTLFSIGNTTGLVSFTPSAGQEGSYNVQICVFDKGLNVSDLSVSYCNMTNASLSMCKNMSLTINAAAANEVTSSSGGGGGGGATIGTPRCYVGAEQTRAGSSVLLAENQSCIFVVQNVEDIFRLKKINKNSNVITLSFLAGGIGAGGEISLGAGENATLDLDGSNPRRLFVRFDGINNQSKVMLFVMAAEKLSPKEAESIGEKAKEIYEGLDEGEKRMLKIFLVVLVVLAAAGFASAAVLMMRAREMRKLQRGAAKEIRKFGARALTKNK